MTERKVLNKYYPPDYDPSKIPRMKQGEFNRKWVQRVMAPFNMRCNTCHEYIYKAKKFNMRREMVADEEYLGIKIWRFYFRCPKCLAEISFKTDLKQCDYAMEHGATRLFEAGKMLQQQAKLAEEKEKEDERDPMKMLEKRTKMSRKEMEELAELEELRETNKRQARPDFETMIGRFRDEERSQLERQEQEDEQFVQKLFGKAEDVKIKRILDDDDDDMPGPSTSRASAVSDLPTAAIEDKKPSTCVLLSEDSSGKQSTTAATKQRKLLAGIVRKKPPTTQSQTLLGMDSKRIKIEDKAETDFKTVTMNVNSTTLPVGKITSTVATGSGSAQRHSLPSGHNRSSGSADSISNPSPIGADLLSPAGDIKGSSGESAKKSSEDLKAPPQPGLTRPPTAASSLSLLGGYSGSSSDDD